MPTERYDIILLGRIIGTATGWDRDEDILNFYEIVPIDSLKDQLPEGDLTVDFECGIFSYHDDEGVVTKTVDMLSVLNKVERLVDGPTV